MMADDRLFDLEIICPDRIFYEGRVTMVELNTTEGEIGVYKNHIPTTMVLQPGVVIITAEDGKKEAAVHAGFVEILKEKVTVMAEVAEWPGEIDVKRANEARQRAQKRMESRDSDLNLARAEFSLRKALVRIEVADSENTKK